MDRILVPSGSGPEGASPRRRRVATRRPALARYNDDVAEPAILELDPRRALTLELPRMPGGARRATLRTLLALSGGAIRVEGAERIAAAPEPVIFALTHHNAWEAVLAPAALVAVRRGRLVRFLVDWMFVDLPWTGWLVRQIDPIPVYAKPALLGLREAHRRVRSRESALERALAALDAGADVGVYPEGRRNPDPWRLADARRGLALLALRSGVPILPVGVDFPARDRLLRTPRAGRFVLRAGEPLHFAAERDAWLDASPDERRALERELVAPILDRVFADLARLSRKVHLPRNEETPVIAEPSSILLEDDAEGKDQDLQLGKDSRFVAGCRESNAVPIAAEAPTSQAVRVLRVDSPELRRAALAVVDEVYREEKGWIGGDVEREIPRESAFDSGQAWFVALEGAVPVGAVRIEFDPTLRLPAEPGVELEPGVDLDRLAASGRFVEIGRLMIRPEWRSRPALVLDLMRAAIEEVVARGYSHLVTAVFEDDPHSPYRFHTRVLGFQRIGTHRRGELACSSRRILLVLDLPRAWHALRARRAKLASQLAGGAEARLAEMLPEPSAL